MGIIFVKTLGKTLKPSQVNTQLNPTLYTCSLEISRPVNGS